MTTNSKPIFVILAILILVGLGAYGLSRPGTDDKEAAPEKEIVTEEIATESDLTIKKGSYETYGPEKLALAEKGKVILFFRASWCPTCRKLDADIRANLDKIPEGVAILNVDYDNSTALKQKYGVTYQHTLVQVDAAGNKLAKWSGSMTLAALLGETQ